MNFDQKSLELHKKYQGKIAVVSKIPLKTIEDLSLSYTPGVAEPCRKIVKNKEDIYTYTGKGNFVAVITDGSAVLGLGNIGPEAALPVMEGKCILFKTFAGLDAFPICLKTQDTEEIIRIIKALEPTFGGINLEDIAAPRCFEIEARLKKELSIPVFHDDQHGTAVVVLAGLINALKVVKKSFKSIKIVMSGAGAAGNSIARLLLQKGVKNIIVCDRHGALVAGDQNLDAAKTVLARLTNPKKESGSLKQVLKGADVFIGVSAPDLLSQEDIKSMNTKAIVFALANPIPEIMPDEAKKGGAAVMATGRSDFPNQLNNVLVFPGMLKGAMKARKQITDDMKLLAAQALSALIQRPTSEKIIPSVFEKGVAEIVSAAVLTSSK